MSDKKIKQHFVPCCYLANFGIYGNHGRESMVFAYDTISKKISEGKIEAFACSNHFYDIDYIDNPNLIEDFFARIEGAFDVTLRRVLALPKDETISLTDKEELAEQFAFLFVRTKSFRDRYSEITKQLANSIPHNKLEDIYKDSKGFFRSVHTKEILSFNTAILFVNMLRDRKWILWRNETSVPFYTSDNPVCIINHDKTPASIIAPKTEDYIPLSTHLAISAYNKDFFPPIGDRSVAGIKDRRVIDRFNHYIAKNCSRFVFSNEKSFDSLD